MLKALGSIIVPVFTLTLLNRSVSQSFSFTAALLCVKNQVYCHLMAQYWYHTKATIEYRGECLEGFHRQKDVLRPFGATESTNMVLDASKCSLLWTIRRNGRVTPLGTINLSL